VLAGERGGALSEDFPVLGWFTAGSRVAGYLLEGRVGAGWRWCSGPAISGWTGWWR
jgi:hypothetical protein